VDKVTYAGREAYYRLRGGGVSRILAHVYQPEPAPLANIGEPLRAEFPLARLHAFDAADSRRIELRP
jgi:hypothetical protein